MKFTLAVALVVLVISQGTESASLTKGKHDIPAEIEKITKYFQDLSTMLTTTTTELMETLKTQDLAGKAEAELKPLLEKVKEQLKPLATNFEEQFKPLSESILAQLKPLAESVEAQVEGLVEKVMDQTKALLPPQ